MAPVKLRHWWRAYARDATGLWLNQHPDAGEAHRGVRDRKRPGAAARGAAGDPKAHRQRAGASREARRLHLPGSGALGAVSGRRRFGRRLGQAGPRQGLSGHHAAARQDPEHLGTGAGTDRQLAGGPRYQRRARGGRRLGGHCRVALPQDLHPGRCRLGRAAHCDVAVRFVLAPFPAAGQPRPCLRRYAAVIPDRCRQAGVLCAGDRRARCAAGAMERRIRAPSRR